MAIEVKHSGSPGATLAASYGAGQSTARIQPAMQAVQAMEARRTLEDQQAHHRDMQEDNQAFSKEMETTRFGHQADLMDLQSRLGKSDFEWRLTAQQKADQERYQNAMYEIDRSDDMDPEMRAEARRRVLAKFAGIQPLPTVKEPSPYPEGQGIGQSWVNPTTGKIETRQADGNVKMADNPNMPTFKDITSMYQDISSSLTKIDPQSGKETSPNPEEIMSRMKEMIKMRQELMQHILGSSGGGGGQQGEPPAQSEVSQISQAELVGRLVDRVKKTNDPKAREMLQRIRDRQARGDMDQSVWMNLGSFGG